ncbi:MAG: Fic family protein [Candidatus Melainabacteria bacterium]|nr:Fic family protein [Candidatus Melainabacteria bacterium]
MIWNWQHKKWPKFSYKQAKLASLEQEFTHKSGIFLGILKHLGTEQPKLDLICEEAYRTSLIEGELLNRESIHSSIRKNFGLKSSSNQTRSGEEAIAAMMVDLYQNYAKQVNHKNLYRWNSLLLYGKADLNLTYRQDDEPMQIVSGSVDKPKIHFEAPPSELVKQEMDQFITWFNSTKSLGALERAGLAHIYFVSIHPFDDGNGRIARALAEKVLSQALGQASLISLSHVIEKHRKKYYRALDQACTSLEITDWLVYFAEVVLQALEYSQQSIEFTLAKAKLYDKHKDQMNKRQAKVLKRVLKEGLSGFEGGLSAENYISISKTSRATATRDLQDLVDKDILKIEGQLKSTRYYPNLSSS